MTNCGRRSCGVMGGAAKHVAGARICRSITSRLGVVWEKTVSKILLLYALTVTGRFTEEASAIPWRRAKWRCVLRLSGRVTMRKAGITVHEVLDSAIIHRTSLSKTKRCIGSVGEGIKSKCSWKRLASSSFACTAKARIPAMSAALSGKTWLCQSLPATTQRQ